MLFCIHTMIPQTLVLGFPRGLEEMVRWCMVHGAWCMVHGVWCMVHVWCMVYGGDGAMVGIVAMVRCGCTTPYHGGTIESCTIPYHGGTIGHIL